jgi:dipeptidyl aminopeptidase/acylaminoacyl peptidase
MSFGLKGTRTVACIALSCALAAAVVAATPTVQLQELDEVLVSARTPLPLQDFVKFPKYESVSISPDGSRVVMAWIDIDYRLQIGLHEFPSMKALPGHTLPSSMSASDASWASNDKLLFRTEWPRRGFHRIRDPLGMLMLSDIDGGKAQYVNREAIGTGEPLDLLRRDEAAVLAAARPYDADDAKLSGSSSGPVRVVSTRTLQPDHILIQTTRANTRSGNPSGGVYLLNVKDMRQTMVATLPLNGAQVVTGPDHQVALAWGVNGNNETEVYYLPPEARAQGKDWKLVMRTAGGARGLQPVAWSGNGEEYYALEGRNLPTRAVVLWNAADNSQKQLHRHANADLDHFTVDPAGVPFVFSGSDHFPVYWYPDPAHPLAFLHRAVVAKVKDEHVEITSASDDMKSAVVKVSSGRRPPMHLVVNVESISSLAALHSYPTLRGTRLARVDPIEFHARDGMVLHAYLTTPEDASGKPRTGLPLIVLSHDGPNARPTDLSYEFERQLFASRGYAVLQVNARGTRGRGLAFERAGDGRWGQQVQDDFIDAVRWAIKDGVADAERVCFYGIGYGAFTAMTAAAREPDLFKCVVGVGGVYDLPRMLGEGRTPVPPALRQVFGDDMTVLAERSPVSQAKAIKARVLLMPQDRDEFVPVEQSARMRDALRAAGNAATWEMLGQQYNGQHTPESRARGYTRIMRFFESHIGK